MVILDCLHLHHCLTKKLDSRTMKIENGTLLQLLDHIKYIEPEFDLKNRTATIDDFTLDRISLEFSYDVLEGSGRSMAGDPASDVKSVPLFVGNINDVKLFLEGDEIELNKFQKEAVYNWLYKYTDYEIGNVERV